MRTTTRLTLAAALATFLGSLPLAGGFTEHRWVWYAMLSVAVVAAIGLLTRAARVAPVITLLAQLLGLLFFHTIAFAHSQAIGGIVPTGASMATLRDAVQNGMNDIQYLAAPVPARQDIVILTSLSVGLIALVVDIIAVTFRRPAVSGLALLALFAVATAVSDGVPWLMFFAAGGGYLVLLAVEGREQLVRWGRMITPDGGPDAGMRGVPRHSSAGRVGVAALAIALIVPLLVPGFTRNVLENIGSSGGGDGSGQTGNSINPFTSLRGELTQPDARDLLKIQTDSPPQYLRTSVLSEFTSKGWRAGPVTTYGPPTGLSQNLPIPRDVADLANIGSARTADAKVTIEAYDGSYLPTYYVPSRVTGLNDEWRYSRDRGEIRGRSPLSPGRTYLIHAVEPHPSRVDLESSAPVSRTDPVMNLWGQVPDTVRPEVKTITESVIHGQGTPWARATALNSYFRDPSHGFSYSLQTREGASSDGLLNFLRTKQGYCEQYASAMAVMLRIAGIPSRVVLGYTPGVQGQDGTWTITNHDAHAWVEADFGRLGWVQFDPTPLSDGRAPTQEFLPGSDEPTIPTAGTEQPTNHSTAPTTTHSTSSPAGSIGPTGGGGPADSHGTTTPTILGLSAGAVVLLALLLAPAFTRRLVRRRRIAAAGGIDLRSAAHAAWAEVVATALDHRIRLPRSESPRATAGRLLGARELPRSAESGLRLLALAEERARYAREPGVEGDLPTALHALIRGLGRGVSRRDRVRIAMAPSSMREAVAASATTAKLRLRESGRNLLRLITPNRRWLDWRRSES